jgi:HEAT repeat protein
MPERARSDGKLQGQPGTGDTPSNAEALGLALGREQNSRVREAIFTSLVRIGTAESVNAVLPHLRANDANLRSGALDALRAMPKSASPHLPHLLRDPDPDVRILACELARNMPVADANSLLCDLLTSEVAANVCSAAVEVLAETGGPECLAALAKCGERFSADPFLSFSIKVASERIGAQPPRGASLDRHS